MSKPNAWYTSKKILNATRYIWLELLEYIVISNISSGSLNFCWKQVKISFGMWLRQGQLLKRRESTLDVIQLSAWLQRSGPSFFLWRPRCDIYYRIEDKYFHSWESFDSQLDTNLLFQLDCRHRGRYTNFLQYFRGSRDLELWAKIQNILMVYILTGNFAYKVFTPLAPPSWHKLLTTPPLINKTRCVPSSSSLSLLLPLQPSWLLLTELLVRLILYNIHRFLWG